MHEWEVLEGPDIGGNNFQFIIKSKCISSKNIFTFCHTLCIALFFLYWFFHWSSHRPSIWLSKYRRSSHHSMLSVQVFLHLSFHPFIHPFFHSFCSTKWALIFSSNRWSGLFYVLENWDERSISSLDDVIVQTKT